MKFHFPLATVLRLREIAEEREERTLAQILRELNGVRQTVAELRDRRRSLLGKREQEVGEPISAFQLQYSYGQVYMVESLILEGQQQLIKLERMRQQQTKAYEVARRDREVLTEMRETQLEQFRYRQTRSEQAVMDDNFAARRHRR
jgi:flagellar export protein FliJ